jgi:hypothetical protein
VLEPIRQDRLSYAASKEEEEMRKIYALGFALVLSAVAANSSAGTLSECYQQCYSDYQACLAIHNPSTFCSSQQQWCRCSCNDSCYL